MDMHKYEIDYSELLGQGSFGKIYKALNIKENKWYAVKIEAQKKDNNNSMQLEHESIIINYANKNASPDYLICYDYYSDNDNNYCILPLLGVSLKRVITQIKTMRMNDIICLAPKLINQIEFYHSAGIIHRDIKPANFMYSCDLAQIFLIDFGLAIKKELSYTENKFKGTINYMSINALKKGPPVEKDDLYSLGYIILNLAYGALFWTDIKYSSKEQRNKKLILLKTNLSNEDLVRNFICKSYENKNKCLGKIRSSKCAHQSALLEYFNYIDRINNDNIDYSYLKNLFNI